MLWAVFLLFCIFVAGLAVLLYVAFPYRGEEMPYAPKAGEAMRSVAQAVPTLDERQAAARVAARRRRSKTRPARPRARVSTQPRPHASSGAH